MSQYSFESKEEAYYRLQGPEENAPEVDEINNTGQTVYEQLQEILNKCIIEGRGYRFIEEYLYCTPTGLRDNDVHSKYYNELISYHELFSKDSGIMEFVEWKKEEDSFLIISGKGRDRDIWYHNSEYQYMIMGPMTAEEKVKYFTENAIVHTKQLSICIECSEEVPEREPVSNCHGHCRLEI